MILDAFPLALVSASGISWEIIRNKNSQSKNKLSSTIDNEEKERESIKHFTLQLGWTFIACCGCALAIHSVPKDITTIIGASSTAVTGMVCSIYTWSQTPHLIKEVEGPISRADAAAIRRAAVGRLKGKNETVS